MKNGYSQFSKRCHSNLFGQFVSRYIRWCMLFKRFVQEVIACEALCSLR